MMKFDCLLAGVGGQGTVLASKLLAQTAINEGLFARTCETIGMAQRGGCVVSHVRAGNPDASPMIPPKTADLLIGFEPAEAVRNLSFLKAGGACIASLNAIRPVTASLGAGSYSDSEVLSFLREHAGKLVLVDARTLCEQAGSSKVLNVILLGAALGHGLLPFSKEALEQTLFQNLPERFHAMNRNALDIGYQSAR